MKEGSPIRTTGGLTGVVPVGVSWGQTWGLPGGAQSRVTFVGSTLGITKWGSHKGVSISVSHRGYNWGTLLGNPLREYI
jgi:hypothetical protein